LRLAANSRGSIETDEATRLSRNVTAVSSCTRKYCFLCVVFLSTSVSVNGLISVTTVSRGGRRYWGDTCICQRENERHSGGRVRGEGGEGGDGERDGERGMEGRREGGRDRDKETGTEGERERGREAERRERVEKVREGD
jgi:hypothetical protein